MCGGNTAFLSNYFEYLLLFLVRKELLEYYRHIHFSERELAFTFAICCRPPSVVCLSVVCNVRAPYSGGSNFRQYFYGIIIITLAIL